MKKGFVLGLLIIAVFLICGCGKKSECGNGIVEEGETTETCCQDVGCEGDQICQDNVCVKPRCGECQYFENNVCKDYECCDDGQCLSYQFCEEHECKEVNCTECQFAANHTCYDYECCDNADCNSTQICQEHVCQDLNCDECEFAVNHTCVDYECCVDVDCDDNESSTKDVCSVTNKTCSHNTITDCEDGDGYCPIGCDNNTDSDCGEGYQVGVLVLSFFPPDDTNSNYVDPDITGLENHRISKLQDNVEDGTNEMIRIIKQGSRYNGSGSSVLNYRVYESKEFFVPIPLSDNCIPWNCPGGDGKRWYRPDYYNILAGPNCEESKDQQGNTFDCDLSIDVCDYVDNKGVKEVWMWGYHGGITEPVESDMSMGNVSREYWNFEGYGDVSNSEHIDDLPTCDKTYTLYNFNYNRVNIPGNIHNQMHQYENIFGWLDDELFWDRFVGPHETYKNDNTNQTYYRCGNCHYPPNAEEDYDYDNKRYVWTDCFDWKPKGGGEVEYINCNKWDCEEGQFQTLWMQSIPGKDNDLIYNGKPMRNWWEFLSDFDVAVAKGKCLACYE